MKLTFIEHACVMLEHDGKVIVIDPFTRNADAVIRLYPQFMHPDYIAITHGHDDHTAALSLIAGKNTKILGIVELCSYLSSHGFENLYGMNFGGTLTFDDISFSLVPAMHSSSENGLYLGQPGGFVIKIGNHTVYHAGDTDAFSDMSLINKFFRPDVGLIPIGGRFTADVLKAAFICNEFFSFDTVIPVHYDTFPPIKADAEKFASLVKCKTLILRPSECKDFDDK